MLRHPRRVLAVAALFIAVFASLGFGIEGKLNPTSLDVPGTDSNKATKLLKQYFGDSAPFAILLQGPNSAIEEQGPALVHALRASDPKVTTVSPWDKGKVGNLRPAPNRALVLVDFHVSVNDAVRYTVDELNEILERKVTPPLQATQTGFATLSRAIQDESINASERSELIALPILLLVLLLVFRSPVAALIPLTFGAITVITSRGVLALLSSVISIDAFALTVSTMMGLALGVDYALLMVSRFREELEEGSEPYDAAGVTRRTAGRTTVFAGSTLFLAMVVSVPILPGALLVSLAGTMMVVVIISVSVATVVAPALMTLLGHNVNRWRIGRGVVTDRSAVMTFVDAALRRPIFAVVVIGGIVLILAGAGDRPQDRPAEHRAAAEQQRRTTGLRRRPGSDRTGLRSPVRGRRCDRRRDDDRTPPARPARQVAAQDRRRPCRAGGDRPRAGGEENGAAEETSAMN